jgi:hypothetical protein
MKYIKRFSMRRHIIMDDSFNSLKFIIKNELKFELKILTIESWSNCSYLLILFDCIDAYIHQETHLRQNLIRFPVATYTSFHQLVSVTNLPPSSCSKRLLISHIHFDIVMMNMPFSVFILASQRLFFLFFIYI